MCTPAAGCQGKALQWDCLLKIMSQEEQESKAALLLALGVTFLKGTILFGLARRK